MRLKLLIESVMTCLCQNDSCQPRKRQRDHGGFSVPSLDASSLSLVLSFPLLLSRYPDFKIGSSVDLGIGSLHLHWRRLLRPHLGTFASSCRTSGRIPAPVRRVCLLDFKTMGVPWAAVFHRRRRRFHCSRGQPPHRCSSSCTRTNSGCSIRRSS